MFPFGQEPSCESFTAGETETTHACLHTLVTSPSPAQVTAEDGDTVGTWREDHAMLLFVLHRSSRGAGCGLGFAWSRRWFCLLAELLEDIVIPRHVGCACQAKHQRGNQLISPIPSSCAFPDIMVEPNILLRSLELSPPRAGETRSKTHTVTRASWSQITRPKAGTLLQPSKRGQEQVQ